MDGRTNGQTDGKSPHSTGLRPLSGPLPGPDKVGEQASVARRHRPQFVGTGRRERKEKRGEKKKRGKKEKKEKKKGEKRKKRKKEERRRKKKKEERKKEKREKRKEEKLGSIQAD